MKSEGFCFININSINHMVLGTVTYVEFQADIFFPWLKSHFQSIFGTNIFVWDKKCFTRDKIYFVWDKNNFVREEGRGISYILGLSITFGPTFAKA